jgi:hypothetical protein
VLVPEVSAGEMTAWLRAQAEADKAAAKAATPGEWAALDGGVMSIEDEGQWPVSVAQSRRDREDRVHIAIHDPRDVIADCDAKLRLLGLHEPVEGVGGGTECEACGPNNGSPPGLIAVIRDDDGFRPCATVLVLASGYRHRDGWQEGWADAPEEASARDGHPDYRKAWKR